MTPTILAAALCITSIHDGDTIRLCDGERIRLLNIDAPEVQGSARCTPKRVRELASSRNPAWCDYQLGNRSRGELRRFIASGTARITRTGYDRYGRTLARITVNGRDAGKHLIGLGLARGWR